MELVSDIVFELDQLPDDYNTIAEHKLVPMAMEPLLDSLDNILVAMGYNKMELAKKCNEVIFLGEGAYRNKVYISSPLSKIDVLRYHHRQYSQLSDTLI